MDTIVFFLIFILILLLIYFVIVKKEDNNYNKEIKVVKSNLEIQKNIPNDFNNNFIDDIDGCEYNDGYENELMYSNNLKDGDYVNLFKETEIKNDVINNNQIGFNPSPREQMKTLPYANIHSKCLYEKNN